MIAKSLVFTLAAALFCSACVPKDYKGPKALWSRPAAESLWPPAVDDTTFFAAVSAAKDDPNSESVLRSLCEAHGSRQNWLGALIPCLKIAEDNPGDALAQRRAAEVAFALHLYDRAAAAAKRLVKLAPDDAAAHASLARSLMAMSDGEEAASALRRAIELNSKDTGLRIELARAYSAQNDYKQAIDVLERADRADPGNAEVGALLVKTRSLVEKKLARPREALNKSDNSPEALHELAAAYYRLGFKETALAHFSTALETLDRDPRASEPAHRRLRAKINYSRGIVLRGIGKPLEAIKSLRNSMKIDPHYASECYYHIGLAQLDLGDAASAVTALRESVRLNPSVGANRRALIQALEKVGAAGEAELERAALERLH